MTRERLTPRNLRFAVAAIAIGIAYLGPLPEPPPTPIRFAFSSDAKLLLTPFIERFNQSQDDVIVDGKAEPSGEVLRRIVDGGRRRPELWMPAASTWGRLLNERSGREMAPEGSPSFFWSPELIGTFDAVLDDHAIEGWDDLADLAIGQEALGLGEAFRLGHTKPTSSTSGLYALVSEFAAVDPDGEPVVDAASSQLVGAIERSVLHYGDIAEDFCPKLLEYSSGAYVSAFYMQETTFLKCEERYDVPGLTEIFPDGTFIADYPALILNAPWVSGPEAEAAARFREWLGDELDRESVLAEEFRFGDPWDEDGTSNDPTPTGADTSQRWEPLAVPSGATLAAVQDAWLDIRKEAEVLILLEKGDMHVDGAIESAKLLLRGFIRALPPGVTVGLDSFDEGVVEEASPAILTPESRIDLIRALNGIGANGADTSLADSILESLQKMDFPDRISVIVLVSLGEEDGSQRTLDELTTELKAFSRRPSPIQVFAISFGDPEGDRILGATATDSLGVCADATRERDEVDRCEKTRVKELLDEIGKIV